MGPLKLLLTLRSRGIGMPSSSVTGGQTQHINVLELTALLNYLRMLTGTGVLQDVKLFHIFDSQVAAAVAAQGVPLPVSVIRCVAVLLPFRCRAMPS